MTTSNRHNNLRGYEGGERDPESRYLNLGARLYDPIIGRFLSVDPLWEAFPSWSPYQYAYNCPVSYKDPTGFAPQKEKGDRVMAFADPVRDAYNASKDVVMSGQSYLSPWEQQKELGKHFREMDINKKRQLDGGDGSNTGSSSNGGRTGLQALDEESKANIIEGHPVEIRHFICFDDDGYIDVAQLKQALLKNDSENLFALFLIASSSKHITIKNSKLLEYQDDKGNRTTLDFQENNWIKGFTALPTDDSGFGLSINLCIIEVTINSYSDKEAQIQYTAHELYIHALFYVLGMDPNHFITIGGKQIMNDQVNKRVDPVENEAIKNYWRNKK